MTPRRRGSSNTILTLALVALGAASAAYLAGRLLLPGDTRYDARDVPQATQPAMPDTGAESPPPTAVTVDDLLDRIDGTTWGAAVEVSGSESGVLFFGPRPFLEQWQVEGVPEGPPLDVTVSFDGAASLLSVVLRGAAEGLVLSERVQVTLRTEHGHYSGGPEECEVSLLELRYHEQRGQTQATRGRTIFIPSFVGWLACDGVVDRDGAGTVSLRGAFVYDFR